MAVPFPFDFPSISLRFLVQTAGPWGCLLLSKKEVAITDDLGGDGIKLLVDKRLLRAKPFARKVFVRTLPEDHQPRRDPYCHLPLGLVQSLVQSWFQEGRKGRQTKRCMAN